MRAFILLAGAVSGHVLIPRACNGDNCLRGLQNPTRALSASSYCSTLLLTSLAATATASSPSWLTNCDGNAAKLSSACSCFMTSVSTGSTTTGPTTSAPTSCPPAATVTLASTITLTLGCSTAASTSISTCPAPSTVSSTFTVTLSPSTVTQPVSTVTSTKIATVSAPEPSTCAQLTQNGGFENPNRDLFPWLFYADKLGPGGGPSLAQLCLDCTVYISFLINQSPGNPVVQMRQGVTSCGGSYQLQFDVNHEGFEADIAWGVQAGFTVPGGTAIASSGFFTTTSEWHTVKLSPWTLPQQGGELVITFTGPAITGSATLNLDNVLLVAV